MKSLVIVATHDKSLSWTNFNRHRTSGVGLDGPVWKDAFVVDRCADGVLLVVRQFFNEGELSRLVEGLLSREVKGIEECEDIVILNHDEKLGATPSEIPKHEATLQESLGRPVYVTHFFHREGDAHYRLMEALWDSFDGERFRALVESVKSSQAARRDPQNIHRRWIRWVHHRLSNLLLPIAVDLQGWCESGWDYEYEVDIGKALDERGGGRVLHDARQLLYGAGSDTPSLATFKGIFPELRESVGTIERLLPSQGGNGVIESTLARLADATQLAAFRAGAPDIAPFREALDALDAAFVDVIRATEGTERSA